MASGDTLLPCPATSGVAPISNGATFKTRNQRPIAEFPAGVETSIDFILVMPQHYAGGGVDNVLIWSMAIATSGDVDWSTSFERVGVGQQNLDQDGFAAGVSNLNNPVPAATLTAETQISHTDGAQIDSIQVGELFRLRVTRLATDQAAGHAQLHYVEIREA